MKSFVKKLLLTVFVLFTLNCFRAADAQTTFWTEGFGTGCTQGNPANNTSTSNGVWVVTASGVNDPEANQFYISATEAGMGVNNCGDGCLGNSGLVNRTLHVANVSTSPSAVFFCPAGDCGAAYDAGGGCGFGLGCVATDKRAESPVINCSGRNGITLSFVYFEGPNAPNDNATVWYFDGTTWAQLADPPTTSPGSCAPQGRWTAYSVPLPASADNNPNVKIGFRWRNNDDGVGSDPSFAVDDVELSVSNCVVTSTTSVTACNNYTAPWGTVYTQSGTYSDTLTTANGCDSIINIILTITGAIVTPPLTASACSSYTAPWGGIYTQSGNYSDTLTTVSGCDSILSVNLTITGAIVTPPLTASACSSYTAPWGGIYTQSGTYSDTLTTASGCDSILSVNLTITGTIVTPPLTASACSSYTAPWGSIYTQSGTYSDTLTTASGCDSILSVNLTITGTIVTPPVTASACSSYTAPWGATYTQSGTYSDTLTTASGCDSIVSVILSVTGIPVLSTTSSADSCEEGVGTAFVLASGGTGGYSYLWSNGASGDSLSNLNAGTYTITVSDQNGCSTSTQLVINSTPPAVISVTASSQSIREGDTVQLNASGAINYLWSPAGGLTCTICPDPVATPSETTTYSVTGTDSSGCTAVASLTIEVDIPCREVFIPNIFSPNNSGPGKNEVLCVYSNCITEMEFAIYNRWGQVVFETGDPNACWDGTFKGEPALQGVYTYRLKVAQKNGNTLNRSGNITLVR